MAILSGSMGVEGLALALSISATLEVLGLVWALRRRIDSIDEAEVLRSGARSLLGAALAAAVMLGGLLATQAWSPDLLTDGIGRVLALVALVGAGALVYLLAAAAMRSEELGLVRRYLSRRRPRPSAA
jgi:peptidoglycan biosynthesis protein MviN/MurJ (putative lipid II flippase)